MPMQRIRVGLSGFPGGPGLATFYATDASALVGPLGVFFAALNNIFPTSVSVSVPTSGDILNELNGQATGGWTGGTPTIVPGINNTGYAAPVGALCRWETGQIRSGRRVRGRTFIVPAASNNFEQNGTLTAGAMTTLTSAAAALVTSAAGGMLVFQRPRLATNAWSDVHGRLHPAVTARVGEVIPVNSSFVPDKAVVLRSRRD